MEEPLVRAPRGLRQSRFVPRMRPNAVVGHEETMPPHFRIRDNAAALPNKRHCRRTSECPLCRRKRTSLNAVVMSAWCHKQTSRRVHSMTSSGLASSERGWKARCGSRIPPSSRPCVRTNCGVLARSNSHGGQTPVEGVVCANSEDVFPIRSRHTNTKKRLRGKRNRLRP